MFDSPCFVRVVLENKQTLGISFYTSFFYFRTCRIFDLGAVSLLWIICRGILCFFIFGQRDRAVLYFS